MWTQTQGLERTYTNLLQKGASNYFTKPVDGCPSSMLLLIEYNQPERSFALGERLAIYRIGPARPEKFHTIQVLQQRTHIVSS